MNSGLSNLDTLRKHLLAGSLSNDARFDPAITAIGLGVATALEQACNRQFCRIVDDVFTCSADRAHIILPRYPVEEVDSVEIYDPAAATWDDLDLDLTTDAKSGMVSWGSIPGGPSNRLRFTYTGGYWFDILEPDDTGYPAALPATGTVSATALPSDLRLAWLLQCEEVWAKRDKLGTALIEKPQAQRLGGLDLLAIVKQMIRPFVRYQMS